MSDKSKKYLDLVKTRKACDLCEGLENPSRCAGGEFDSDEIGPWSRWQGSLDALVMIVAQDWGGVDTFRRQCGVDVASATNKTLCDLLKLAGLKAELPSSTTQRGELFCTNAVLCLKQGGDQATLRTEWKKNCSKHFMRPQIEIIQPKLVICLGTVAYESVLRAYGLRRERFVNAVEREEPLDLPGGIKMVAVYHCARRVLNRNRNLEAQQRDWKRIAAVVKNLRSKQA